MDLDQAIHARRAVREYTAEPVDEATLRRLIDAAVLAPSAVNEQPWLFSIVRDKAVLASISNAAKAHILATPPVDVPPHHFHELLDDPNFDILYRAPALIVIASATRGQWAVENCSLAAENLMLEARAADLGTCWIGFAQVWLGTAEGKATIGLPHDCLPVAPIIIGHPKSFPAAVPRKAADIRWIGRSSESEPAPNGQRPVLHLRSDQVERQAGRMAATDKSSGVRRSV
jgi:nitroreductase